MLSLFDVGFVCECDGVLLLCCGVYVDCVVYLYVLIVLGIDCGYVMYGEIVDVLFDDVVDGVDVDVVVLMLCEFGIDVCEYVGVYIVWMFDCYFV